MLYDVLEDEVILQISIKYRGVLNLLVLAYPQITNCTKIVPPKKTKVIFVQLIIFLAIAIFAIPNFFSELNTTTCSFC